MVSFSTFSLQFSVLVSCHVIKNVKIDVAKGLKSGIESGWLFIRF